MQYYVLPNCSVACNPRVASMSTAQAIMLTFYPLFAQNCITAADYWRAAQPLLTTTPTTPTYLLVRDPVTRFQSACNVYMMDVATALSKMNDLMATDVHFMPQSGFTYTTAFQYETQIAAFCSAAGLPLLNVTNDSTSLPALSDDQVIQLQTLYSADVTLHSSLTPAGS